MKPFGMDVEELAKIIDTVRKLLEQLGPLIKDIITAVLDAYSGERIGREVADFYSQLQQKGLPPEMVQELTIKYFENLMVLEKIVKSFKERT